MRPREIREPGVKRQRLDPLKRSRPIFLPASAFAAGIILGEMIDWAWPVSTLTAALALSLAVAARWRGSSVAAFVATLFFMTSAGVLAITCGINPVTISGNISDLIPLGETSVTTCIEGVLLESSRNGNGSTRLVIDVDRSGMPGGLHRVDGKVLVFVEGPSMHCRTGQRVRMRARLKRPRNRGNPGEVEVERNLRLDGIDVVGSVGDPRFVVVTGEAPLSCFRRVVLFVQAKAEALLESVRNIETGGVMLALLTGRRDSIPDPLREAFVLAGASHILAISGLHIGIIAVTGFFFISAILRISTRVIEAVPVKQIAAGVSLAPVLLYSAMTGFRPPTVRAGIMVLCVFLGSLLGRGHDSLQTLGVAAMAILAIDPGAFFDVSFQLSFISVFFIIVVDGRLFERKDKERDEETLKQRAGHWGIRLVTASSAAIIGTIPVAAWHFHRVTWIGLLSNLVVVPVVGFIVVPLLFLSVVLYMILPAVGSILLIPAEALLSLTTISVRFFAAIPWGSFRVPRPPPMTIVSYYLLIGAILWRGRSKIKIVVAFLALSAMTASITWMEIKPTLSKKLLVTFVSVGQGDCALVEFPGGRRMLVDGGGGRREVYDVGKRVVAPFLRNRGIRRVDILALSHPQSDHIDGLVTVAKEFSPSQLWTNGRRSVSESYVELIDTLREAGGEHRVFSSDAPPEMIGGVLVEFLHPANLDSTVTGDGSTINDESLVVRLSYGEVSFLFTGDVLASGEQEILMIPGDIKTTVLKTAHHGSASSTTTAFLDRVRPKVAVCSVGYGNRFRFPSEPTLEKLRASGAVVYRTDIHGAVECRTDGRFLEIKSYRE
ncbi:DNA internalization-related competence protein ComEC/Rec2 [Thermodesulfobacteriota bacterium]